MTFGGAYSAAAMGPVKPRPPLIYPDQSTTYTYDAAYNRLTEHSLKADGSPLLERYYAYDSRNQLLQIEDTTSGLLTTYAYDANGNRIQRSAGTEIQSYQFDIRNQIREIKLGGSSVGQFLYDYQGLRIRKTTPTATRTVYDDQSVLLQTDADGNTLAKYTYGSDHLFSLTHHSQPPQFYLFDALGSSLCAAGLFTLAGTTLDYLMSDRREQVFELYIAGDRPQDAKVISCAKVDRLTGEVKVEVFLQSVQ